VAAVRHALTTVVDFWSVGTRVGLPWIVALSVADGLAYYASGTPAAEQTLDDPLSTLTPFDAVLSLIGMLAMCSIAVGWHRFILRDEMPAPGQMFRLDRLVWSYFGRTLFIALVVLVPLAIAMLAIFSLAPALLAVALVPALASAVLMLRLSVSLPGIALGEPPMSLTRTLDLTRGTNTGFLAIFLLVLSILIAGMIIITIILSLFQNLLPGMLMPMAIVLSVPFNLFYTLFSISLLTSLYGHFIEGRQF
jgi:hypothetical protein